MVLAVAVCVACTEADIDEATNNAMVADKIYATIDETECDDTRVELNERKQTVWTKGDEIFTFSDGEVYIWDFDGNTGDRSGSFTRQSNHYTFVNNGIIFDQTYAVYLADLRISSFSDNSPAFFATLTSEQSYKEHSYGLKTNAMLGTGPDGKNFKFKNLFGYLRLSLTGDKMVKSIKVSGNNGENLAGQVYIDKHANVGLYSPESTWITLDCGDGVQLSDKPTDFYITMLPQTLSKGISVVVTFTDDTVFPKSTTKSITIERNTIQPMSTFNSSGDVEWQTATIKHSGERVGWIYIYGATSLSGYIYWGDGYMSDINSTTSYVYDDDYAEHTITVKALDATHLQILDCTGISEIDLSNF